MYRGFLLPISLATLSLVMAAAPIAALAQVSSSNSTNAVDASNAYQAGLQAQLDQAQKDLDALNAQSAQITSQKQSLERDIALLDLQIKRAQAQIKVENLAIAQLTSDIGDKQTTITSLQGKLDQSSQSLANLIRSTNVDDAVSLPAVLLSDQNFSQFFVDVDSFQTINKALRQSMEDVKSYKIQTETEKADLETKKNKEIDAQQKVLADERTIQRTEADKNQILSVTKGQEAAYAKLIQQKQQKIAQISTALFALRDANGIQFGTALQYADTASQKTGVRPAFILAILTQETSLGKNLGSCYLSNTATGDGVSVTTGAAKPRTMSPSRDVPTFLSIARGLGLDPLSQRVSCWIPIYSRGAPIGWGGAMGPAQFIPSTWTLFASRIQSALNVPLANPWDPEQAILASALYLQDLGAGSQTYTAEENAACKYYSGKSCSAGTGLSYGQSVMAKAANIQECEIDPIEGKSSGC